MLINESDYLAHYGVKGMKWGVRHDYIPVGRKKGSSKVTTEKKELTEEERKARNKAIAKKIAIGAAVSVGVLAVAGYTYYNYKEKKFLNDSTERDLTRLFNPIKVSSKPITLKKGQVFQRISSKSFEELSETGRTYVSYLEKDNRIYKRIMPDYIEDWKKQGIISKDGAGAYVHKLVAKTDIKVAPSGIMAKVWKQMVSDGEIKETSFRNFTERMNEADNPEILKYISKLKSMGYHAAIDINDQGMTESPLLVFDPSSVLESSQGRLLGKIERIINTMRL